MQEYFLTHCMQRAILYLEKHTAGAAMTTSLMNMKNIIIFETYGTIKDEIVEFTSLSHQSISGSFLSNSLFTEVDFDHCGFFSTNLKNVKFIGCHFSNCNFSFAKFEECNFISCTFENCTFCITNSLNTSFQTCTFTESSWNEGQTTRTDFIGCKSDSSDWNHLILEDQQGVEMDNDAIAYLQMAA